MGALADSDFKTPPASVTAERGRSPGSIGAGQLQPPSPSYPSSQVSLIDSLSTSGPVNLNPCWRAPEFGKSSEAWRGRLPKDSPRKQAIVGWGDRGARRTREGFI